MRSSNVGFGRQNALLRHLAQLCQLHGFCECAFIWRAVFEVLGEINQVAVVIQPAEFAQTIKIGFDDRTLAPGEFRVWPGGLQCHRPHALAV